MLTGVIPAMLLELLVSDIQFTFDFDEIITRDQLYAWVAKRFTSTGLFQLYDNSNVLLPQTWVASPSIDPISIVVKSVSVGQFLEFVNKEDNETYGPFEFPLQATANDILTVLKDNKPGEYRFFIGSTECFLDRTIPIHRTKLPMGAIEVTFSRLPEQLLEVNLVLPPDDTLVVVNFPSNATIADAVAEAISRVGGQARFVPFDAECSKLAHDLPLVRLHKPRDVFFHMDL
jgi:hypothetical protein